MSDLQAKVTSVQALESFRSVLVLFLSKARPTLEEVTSEVSRTRQWLENDQRKFWEKELKHRKRELEHAQAELFSAMLSKISTASAAQQMAVHRAQRAIHEAEDKMRSLKKWERELETRTEPMVKLIEQMHGFLSSDMNKAVSFLTEIVKTLQSYADITVPGGGPAPAQANVEAEATPVATPEAKPA